MNIIANRTARDSSFHYVPFGTDAKASAIELAQISEARRRKTKSMTICALRDRTGAMAALKAPPLLPSLHPANRCHSELRGTKQEESHPTHRHCTSLRGQRPKQSSLPVIPEKAGISLFQHPMIRLREILNLIQDAMTVSSVSGLLRAIALAMTYLCWQQVQPVKIMGRGRACVPTNK
jgi:hypothetical protein